MKSAARFETIERDGKRIKRFEIVEDK